MKRPLLLCVFLCAFVVAAAQAGSLSGVVRDEHGIPVAGARITLAGSETFATTSDTNGGYSFSSLPPGLYHLEASLSGFDTQRPAGLSISETSAHVTMDLTMSRSPSEPAARPQFEAAGVRGLIDPGGYSAGADAAAASGLIKGIADIKRTGNAQAASMPCALEPALKKAVEEKPESGDAALKLGEFYLAHGQAEKAVPMLERAETLNKGGPPEIRPLLARADESMGKFVEASREYEFAANEQPNEENLFGVGYELILAGLPKEAQRAFESGVKRFPQSSQLLIGLGGAQFLTGHTSESVQTLLRAVQVNPANPRPYPFLAEASGVSSDHADEVRGAFEHYLSIAPADARASYYCALNRLREPGADGDTSRIEALLKHAILLDPDLAGAHFELGVLHERRGDYQRAAEELKTAVRLSPKLKDAHYRLAVAYRQTGHMDLSAKEMQRFQDLQESSSAKTMNIDQFISVVEVPESVGKQCPADSPP